MLDTSWGIFFLPIFIMLGAALYLILSYFIKSYREAINPPTEPEAKKENTENDKLNM
jgi:hypothetical protein